MSYAAFGKKMKSADVRAFNAWAAQSAAYGREISDEAFGRWYEAIEKQAREIEVARRNAAALRYGANERVWS